VDSGGVGGLAFVALTLVNLFALLNTLDSHKRKDEFASYYGHFRVVTVAGLAMIAIDGVAVLLILAWIAAVSVVFLRTQAGARALQSG
jgi:hypothetical protein